MSLPSNRHTQFNLLGLAGTDSNASSSEVAQTQHPAGMLEEKTLNKKRARSPEDVPEMVSDTSKKTSRLDRIQATEPLRPKAIKESPWKYYEKIYDLELAGEVEVAVRKADPNELVHVRTFTSPGAEKALYRYQHLQHANIVTALDAFTTDTGLFLVVEAMPISLERMVQSPAYPNEAQLAAIMGQLLKGIAYLEAEGLEHGSLCCSNILLDTDGTLKISNQECCGVMSRSKDGRDDLRALSSIMMELMQKYVKEDAAIGIDDLHRWQSSSDAVGLLSATTSAASAAELLKVSIGRNICDTVL
ncbi:uncharacterized protein HMPREF1541_10635 [Cyphellophora europaea CBS 101466]|uniref:Protein kinase domain-containing protein n=1 Tax=Cyphellophora europaea (strain CBS 101466) TaxID=1220924 RepID=W2S980_CYPE1|nr:uncharacterized protein HMPREF1541_10635 [Cyphellophora europaea CBS 101466]ETN44454.1 hypothetical protein HMPREF1541_10635 [Cyphellophora europaea CBS 101466]